MAKRFRNSIRRPDLARRKGGKNTPRYDEELDLHGFRVEEALSEVDHFLNENCGERVLIIHGKGTGALKNAIRNFLRESPLVDQIWLGEESNLPGMDGVVLVQVR